MSAYFGNVLPNSLVSANDLFGVANAATAAAAVVVVAASSQSSPLGANLIDQQQNGQSSYADDFQNRFSVYNRLPTHATLKLANTNNNNTNGSSYSPQLAGFSHSSPISNNNIAQSNTQQNTNGSNSNSNSSQFASVSSSSSPDYMNSYATKNNPVASLIDTNLNSHAMHLQHHHNQQQQQQQQYQFSQSHLHQQQQLNHLQNNSQFIFQNQIQPQLQQQQPQIHINNPQMHQQQHSVHIQQNNHLTNSHLQVSSSLTPVQTPPSVPPLLTAITTSQQSSASSSSSSSSSSGSNANNNNNTNTNMMNSQQVFASMQPNLPNMNQMAPPNQNCIYPWMRAATGNVKTSKIAQ